MSRSDSPSHCLRAEGRSRAIIDYVRELDSAARLRHTTVPRSQPSVGQRNNKARPKYLAPDRPFGRPGGTQGCGPGGDCSSCYATESRVGTGHSLRRGRCVNWSTWPSQTGRISSGRGPQPRPTNRLLCLSISVSVCLSVCLSPCQSVDLSCSLSLCLFTCHCL